MGGAATRGGGSQCSHYLQRHPSVCSYPPPYALSGTRIAYVAMLLCYAMCSTRIALAAMRLCSVLCGTVPAYAATSCVLCGTVPAYAATSCDEKECAAAGCVVLSYSMLLGSVWH
eukprot:2961446-Rhodomonas_salina.1